MSQLSEFLQDHKGSSSISRAIPAVVIAWILLMATYATVKAGVLVDIPPGWREIFTTALLFYGLSKAREAVTEFTQKGATDAAQ